MKKLCMAIALVLLLFACGKDSITMVNADSYEELNFDLSVGITYSDSDNATVTTTSSDIKAEVVGNHVTITNSGSHTVKYTLSGSTSDGCLKIYSAATQAIVLQSVSLANATGAAINVQGPADSPSDGERVYIVMEGGSTLSDGSTYSTTGNNEDEKAALFAEGTVIVCGNGSLTIDAKGKSGLASDDEVQIVAGSLTINSTASTTASNGDTLKISGIKAKDGFVLDGGSLTVSATGTGAKGISGDGTAIFNGGTAKITTTGSNFGASSSGRGGMGRRGNNNSNSVAAKGIKFKGDITFNGGTVVVSSSSHEGIESKSSLTINGGEIYSYSGADDAINASTDITIGGGYVAAISTSNDGLDANGNMYLKGGVIYAVGATSPEEAIDVNIGETDGVELVLTGGTIIAIGGLSSGATLKQSCYSATYTSGTAYTLTVGGTTYTFTAPSGAGSPLVVSGSATPTLQSGGAISGGTAYCNSALTIGGTLSGGTTASLSSYSGGNSGGNGGGNGGGPGGHH